MLGYHESTFCDLTAELEQNERSFRHVAFTAVAVEVRRNMFGEKEHISDRLGWDGGGKRD